MNNKMNTILERGKPFVFLWNEEKQTEARIFSVSESRGYQTGYCHKVFFYLVTYKNGLPEGYAPMTRDPRKHGLIEYWNTNNIAHKITDINLFNEWLTR